MIKKVLVVVFMVLMASIVFATDDTSTDAANVTKTASPFYVGKFAIGYNGGLNFRFFPTSSWGFEIPLSGSFADPYSINIPSYHWSILSGVNLLLPIKNNFETLLCFEPGIALSGGETFYESTLSSGVYSDYYGDFNRYDQVYCTFSAGITAGLEAEVFLNKIWDRLPPNISFAGKIAVTYWYVLNESWEKNDYVNGSIRDYNFLRAGGFSFSLLNSTSALTNFTVRYYF